MKQLKSRSHSAATRSQDLRSLFENSITIKYVAEPLKAVNSSLSVQEDFDVVNIQNEEMITAYFDKNSLIHQILGNRITSPMPKI